MSPQISGPPLPTPVRPSQQDKPKRKATKSSGTAVKARESFAAPKLRAPGELTEGEQRIQDDIIRSAAGEMAKQAIPGLEDQVEVGAKERASHPTNKKYTVFVEDSAEGKGVSRAINAINERLGKKVVSTTTQRNRADAIVSINEESPFAWGEPSSPWWGGITNKRDVRNEPLPGRTSPKDRIVIKPGFDKELTEHIVEHEIGHGLGLSHTTGRESNLMDPGNPNPEENLTDEQKEIIRDAYTAGLYTNPTRTSRRSPKRGRKK